MRKLRIPIKGMTCTSCARTVENTLKLFPQVRNVSVQLASETADIVYEDDLDWEKVVNELKEIGYEPLLSEVDIYLELDETLVSKLERELESKLHGVIRVSYNPINHVLNVLFSPEELSVQDILDFLRRKGFEAQVVRNASDILEIEIKEKEKHFRELFLRALFSSFFSIPLLVNHVLHLGMHPIVQLLLATPVQFVFGGYFIKQAFNALRSRNMDMNVLIALGTLSAYFGSFLHFVNPEFFKDVYFEASAVIITVVLIGKYLEARAKFNTTSALRKLLALKPQRVKVVRNGKLEEVHVDELGVGDVFVVGSGERIATDGKVIEGEAEVDESFITGESLPVYRKPGDEVFGGSLVVKGYLKVQATKVGKETLIGQIVRMVKEAQTEKSRVQSLADKVSSVFVPVVVTIAILSFLFWLLIGPEPRFNNALLSAISVLVVSCPCALGIAIPSVIAVALSKATEFGILIRNALALENASSIDTVVFDKTGTLTKGKFKLVSKVDEEHLKYIAPLETLTNHPIAEAFKHVKSDYKVDSYRYIVGKGVVGVVNGRKVVVGNEKLTGRSGLSYYIEGVGEGSIELEDELKEDALEVVRKLKRMGYKVYVVSGDTEEHVRKVASKLNVDGYVSQASPVDKVKFIEKLRNQGHRVCFVGDGINDAPVMSRSDLSIAIGNATDIAKESGDIIIMNERLMNVVVALKLAKVHSRKVKQNLFWAFIYNILLIPFAAGGHMLLFGKPFNPIWSAVAMGLSDVFVVGNALSLYRFKP